MNLLRMLSRAGLSLSSLRQFNPAHMAQQARTFLLTKVFDKIPPARVRAMLIVLLCVVAVVFAAIMMKRHAGPALPPPSPSQRVMPLSRQRKRRALAGGAYLNRACPDDFRGYDAVWQEYSALENAVPALHRPLLVRAVRRPLTRLIAMDDVTEHCMYTARDVAAAVRHAGKVETGLRTVFRAAGMPYTREQGGIGGCQTHYIPVGARSAKAVRRLLHTVHTLCVNTRARTYRGTIQGMPLPKGALPPDALVEPAKQRAPASPTASQRARSRKEWLTQLARQRIQLRLARRLEREFDA